MAFGALFWYPKDLTRVKTLRKSLESIQGKFLRAITGAYKATAIEALEIETFTEPLDLYLEKSASQGAARQVLRGYGKEGRLFRDRLWDKYRGRGQPRLEPSLTPVLRAPIGVRPEITESPAVTETVTTAAVITITTTVTYTEADKDKAHTALFNAL